MAEPVIVNCPSCGASFRVEADHLGKTFTCANCQRPFQAALAGAPMPPLSYGGGPPQFKPATGGYPASGQAQKTSGMAIASLICGIFFCIPLTSILALIFGIIGINQTKGGRAKGHGIAIAGTVLGGVGLVLIPFMALMISILLPSLNKARETANRAKCASNMHQIGLAILLYQNDNHHAYPPDLQTLAQAEPISTAVFVCPSSNDTPAPDAAHLNSGGHLSYVYVGADLDPNAVQSSDIMLYENAADHTGNGTNILFVDGHVEWFNAAAAKRLIDQLPAKN